MFIFFFYYYRNVRYRDPEIRRENRPVRITTAEDFLDVL